jgi:hypothetical protein
MSLPRNFHVYQNSVEAFLRFAVKNASSNAKILCSCIKCANGVMRTEMEA